MKKKTNQRLSCVCSPSFPTLDRFSIWNSTIALQYERYDTMSDTMMVLNASTFEICVLDRDGNVNGQSERKRYVPQFRLRISELSTALTHFVRVHDGIENERNLVRFGFCVCVCMVQKVFEHVYVHLCVCKSKRERQRDSERESETHKRFCVFAVWKIVKLKIWKRVRTTDGYKTAALWCEWDSEQWVCRQRNRLSVNFMCCCTKIKYKNMFNRYILAAGSLILIRSTNEQANGLRDYHCVSYSWKEQQKQHDRHCGCHVTGTHKKKTRQTNREKKKTCVERKKIIFA